VAVLVENPAFFSMMRSNLELPMKELVKYSGASRKIIEKHRKYIIAAAEILNGEFPELGEYFSYISKVIRK
jgi:RNA polymerase sigma factor